MSNSEANDSAHGAATRRALIIADAAGLGLRQQLAAAGYLTLAAQGASAPSAINEFSPDVVIMVVAHAGGENENENVALARKLRAETATYSLPIVFAWSEDERSLRAAAQYAGADDYFSLATPPAEILARLDSLFWRVECDRRNAPVVSDRRLEIDNFMFMLDAVREDIRAGQMGTLALVYAINARGKSEMLDKAVRDRTLVEAHNFLKLNLRRIDAAAYYGPTTLLVYLPRMDTKAAVAALSRLHREFREEHPDRDVVAGVASFPTNGRDVEGLIEKAEEAVNQIRKDASEKRVLAYEGRTETPRETSIVSTEPRSEPSLPKETEAPVQSEVPVQTVAPVSISSTEVTSEAASEEVKEEAIEIPAVVSVKSDGGNGAHGVTAEEAAQAATEAAASEMERRASGAIMPRRLLLTVSDATRMTQINSLIRSAGYEARAAFNGQQALDLLRIERPDLLLLDYELQGIDGLETMRRLRKQSGGRLSLPVVMLLSSDNESARREALELGARSVLKTPYDPAELLASLRLAGSAE